MDTDTIKFQIIDLCEQLQSDTGKTEKEVLDEIKSAVKFLETHQSI